MTHNLILLLFLGLSIALMALDGRNPKVTSNALWIPTLWMLICGSRMVSQWFSFSGSISSESYSDGSPLDRNIFLALIIIAFMIVIVRRVSFLQFARNNPFLCVFLLYAAISIGWSDFQEVSFKRYVKEVGNLLMVMIVLSERDPVEAIRTLIKRCAYLLVPLSIVLYKYFPALGRTYGRWSGQMAVTGVTNNKNSLGLLCAVCGIGLVWNLLPLWKVRRTPPKRVQFLIGSFVLALTLWVLLLSQSATSMGCLIVGAAIITTGRLRVVRRNIQLLFLAIVCLVGVVYAMGDLVSLTASTMGRDETLTGRTEIWHSTLQMVSNPLIGGGYSSFWLGKRLETLWEQYSWRPTEAHDGYLEIYLDMGLIGVFLLLGVIVSSFRQNLKLVKTNFEFGIYRLAFLSVVVLYNITESAFRPGVLMYFFFILVAVRLPQPVKTRGRKLRSAVPISTPVTRTDAPVAFQTRGVASV